MASLGFLDVGQLVMRMVHVYNNSVLVVFLMFLILMILI